MSYCIQPKLIISALSTFSFYHRISTPFFFQSFLSSVRICSNNITESLSNLYFSFQSLHVGIFALLILPVIAATITVGLYLLPVSF